MRPKWARQLVVALIVGAVIGAAAALFLRYFPTNAHDPSDPPTRTLTSSWYIAGWLGVAAGLVVMSLLFFWAFADDAEDGDDTSDPGIDPHSEPPPRLDR